MLGVSDEPGPAAVALAVALSALLREIAVWQRERDREHQAVGATAAADAVGRWAAEWAATPALAGAALDHESVVRRPRHDRAARRRSSQPRG
jgi:hypothetical protein